MYTELVKTKETELILVLLIGLYVEKGDHAARS
jgi:hypothetical protein